MTKHELECFEAFVDKSFDLFDAFLKVELAKAAGEPYEALLRAVDDVRAEVDIAALLLAPRQGQA